jgi:hypothetical protein
MRTASALLILLVNVAGCGEGGAVLRAAEKAAQEAAEARVAAEAAEKAALEARAAADALAHGEAGAASTRAGSHEHSSPLEHLGPEAAHHGPELVKHGLERMEAHDTIPRE